MASGPIRRDVTLFRERERAVELVEAIARTGHEAEDSAEGAAALEEFDKIVCGHKGVLG